MHGGDLSLLICRNGNSWGWVIAKKTILDGESARESDDEYFKLLRSAFVADSEALCEMVTRDRLAW